MADFESERRHTRRIALRRRLSLLPSTSLRPGKPRPTERRRVVKGRTTLRRRLSVLRPENSGRGPAAKTRVALAGLCTWVAVQAALSASMTLSAGLTVTHRARSVRPGEVVVLTIESVRPLREVRVTAFDRSFPSFEAGNARTWSGLIGIDLDTPPGRHTAEVHGIDADGHAVEATHRLVVIPRKFPARRFKVDEKFVSPPASELARIEKDSARVRAVLDAVSPGRFWNGPFILPVPGPATSGFGKRSVYNGQLRRLHTGTDFGGEVGTPIKAPGAGKVVLAADLYYSGNTIIIDHGQGLYSYLGHMSAFSVSEGDVVAAGDVVGEVGATGLATGPHLHWSIRLAGTRVDPLSLVSVLKPRKH